MILGLTTEESIGEGWEAIFMEFSEGEFYEFSKKDGISLYFSSISLLLDSVDCMNFDTFFPSIWLDFSVVSY